MKTVCLFITILILSAHMRADEKKRRKVIRFEVFLQHPNVASPWVKEKVQKTWSLGVPIKHKEGYYLVGLASNFEDSILTQFRVKEKTYRLTKRLIDWERNLVFFPIEDDKIKKLFDFFTLSKSLSSEARYRSFSVQENGHNLIQSIKIRDYQLAQSPRSAYLFLHLVASIGPYNCRGGEPLYDGKDLIGLCHKGHLPQKKYIGAKVIENAFENFTGKNSKQGYPSFGFEIGDEMRPLVYPHIGFLPNILKEEDEIISLDGFTLLSEGKIKHKVYGVVDYRAILLEKKVGDKIKLKVKRKKKEKEISLTLSLQDSNAGPVRYYRKRKSEPYILFGGVLVLRLSLDYLMSWGPEWRRDAPRHLVNILKYGRQRSIEGDAIFVAHVFPDDATRGFSQHKFSVIDSIDGKDGLKFRELYDHLQASENEKRRFLKIKFLYGDGEFLVDKVVAPALNKRIKKIYSM